MCRLRQYYLRKRVEQQLTRDVLSRLRVKHVKCVYGCLCAHALSYTHSTRYQIIRALWLHTMPGETSTLTMAMHLTHTAMYLDSNNERKNHKNVGASFVIHTRPHTVRIRIQTMTTTTATTSLDYILISGVQHIASGNKHPTAAIKLKRKTLYTEQITCTDNFHSGPTKRFHALFAHTLF